jgi:hypothetical protein
LIPSGFRAGLGAIGMYLYHVVFVRDSSNTFYRGCLTPRVIGNIRDALGEEGELNFDLLDGFDELPADIQEKIKKAMEDGEVAEADKIAVSDFYIVSLIYMDQSLIAH